MKIVHSYWAYLVLLILVLAVVNALIGMSKKKPFAEKDLRISLFALIVTHIQLLIGLGWYFMSPWYKSMKEIGVDTSNRLLAIEHPLMMLVGIIFITIGWTKHKKQTTDAGKFKSLAIFYGIGLLLILARIPWQQWPIFS
ncbi:hypothetical protein MWU59_02260 [Flavobacteriaceae bacterium F08102]|nr:hypothetical protein [Flavobacteriaceae bacterium F08102]